ncbi:glycosyltransferase [Kiloniella antarctica]|uniref:Glycosyltransferase n=1 Tax=Kiloniella antarctica TaxID=1550907 RepID=A0ABW5BR70_9PROT
MTIKVVHLNRWDIKGGAAIAAYRQHKALQQVGLKSQMYVAEKLCDDESVLELDIDALTSFDITHREVIRDKAKEITSKHAGAIRSDLGPFTLPFAPFGPRMIAQLPEADIINLHWVCGFVDYQEFFFHKKTAVPMIWTLHDMYPFTGGCHYAGACEKFINECGACPYISSENQDDMSRFIHKTKHDAMSSTAYPITIVTPSKWLAKEARRSRIFGDMDIKVIPYSLNLDQFKPRPQRAMREYLDLPKDKVIGFFPSDHLSDPRKGIIYLEEALKCLTPEQAANMLLVSVGNSERKLSGLVEQRSLSFISDPEIMSKIYNASDFTFLPSLEDNLPNIILESMASGTPLIGFDTGGLPDFIKNGETGWIVPKRNVSQLASAIDDALSFPEKLIEMRRVVRNVAEREFAMKVQGERYKDLYEQTLENYHIRGNS